MAIKAWKPHHVVRTAPDIIYLQMQFCSIHPEAWNGYLLSPKMYCIFPQATIDTSNDDISRSPGINPLIHDVVSKCAMIQIYLKHEARSHFRYTPTTSLRSENNISWLNWPGWKNTLESYILSILNTINWWTPDVWSEATEACQISKSMTYTLNRLP